MKASMLIRWHMASFMYVLCSCSAVAIAVAVCVLLPLLATPPSPLQLPPVLEEHTPGALNVGLPNS